MLITLCHVGDRVTIKKIRGNDEVKAHLKGLGFVEGSEIVIINKVNNSVIVSVKASRIALDQSMASRILV